jgi:ParB-like chromosome segregation protein Spo0J
VDDKVKSITEIGLLNAITVSVHPTKPTIGEPQRPRYLLRAGLHRLEACKILGWQEIPAIITKADRLVRRPRRSG